MVDAPTAGLGSHVFTPAIWAHLATALRLRPRQLQIVQGVFDGLGDKGIGAELGITEDGVGKHFAATFQKLGVSSRTGMIAAVTHAYFVLAGLAPWDSAEESPAADTYPIG